MIGKVSNPCKMEDKSPDLGAKINEYYNYNNPILWIRIRII